MLKRLRSTLSFKKNSPIREGLRHVRTHQLLWLRRRIARFRRKRSEATFIGITGSSAKSTTTALLAHILAGHAPTRGQTITNNANALIKTMRNLSRKDRFVVAELGVGAKGKMRPMAEILLPDVSIVTLIGIEHYSAFRSREAVAEEKGHMVELTSPDGMVLLNADDDVAMTMASRTTARIVTFGRSEKADYRILSTAAAIPGGLSVEVGWAGGTLSLKTRYLGEHFALSVVAAAAAALELGVPPETVVVQAASASSPQGRFELYETPDDGPTFILDTAKAPLGTLSLAFNALGNSASSFRRIVLGPVSDYSGPSQKAYRKAYKAARDAADSVIFLGDHAHRSGASTEDQADGRFAGFVDPKQAHEHIRSTVRENEIILVKCSPTQHLERLALAWTTDVQCWVVKCGKTMGCRACGLYAYPFEQHKNILRARRRRRLHERLRFWSRTA